MDCSKFQTLVTDYIENSLSEEIRQMFVEHYERCVMCKNLVGRMQSLVTNLNNMNGIKTSDDFEDKLKTRIYGGSTASRPFLRKPAALGLSAAIVVVSIGGYFFMSSTPSAKSGFTGQVQAATNGKKLEVVDTIKQAPQNEDPNIHLVGGTDNH